MAMRTYTLYLRGGANLTIKAARFEKTKEGIVFFDEDDQPLNDTYIDPAEVIAVVPPAPVSSHMAFPSL